jgi:hypothetical protein
MTDSGGTQFRLVRVKRSDYLRRGKTFHTIRSAYPRHWT